MVQLTLRRYAVAACAALTVLSVAWAPITWAAELPLALVSLSSPVAPFTDATLEIQTTPGALCQITVRYKSGPSRAKGLGPQQADSAGRVRWVWRVGSRTTPGHWPITVTCRKSEDRGELRTTFEVRS